jgi:uncharacterized protein YoxC
LVRAAARKKRSTDANEEQGGWSRHNHVAEPVRQIGESVQKVHESSPGSHHSVNQNPERIDRQKAAGAHQQAEIQAG